VEACWNQVWNAHDPEKVDDFVVEDFVITTGGERIEVSAQPAGRCPAACRHRRPGRGRR
jgi:hypothetical protein